MKKIFIFLLALCAAATSCTNKSEKEIEEETAPGVVLVQNNSYYEVVLSNGESLFFTGFDNDGDIQGIAFNEDSVKVATSYGTGFFVSETGEMATNAHVVSNMVADKEVNKSVSKVIDALKNLVALEYKSKEEELSEAQQACAIAYFSDDISADTYYRVQAYRDEVQKSLEECQNTYNELDRIRPADSEIKYHNEISIAYNNTFVTNEKDFVSCVVADERSGASGKVCVSCLVALTIMPSHFVFLTPPSPLQVWRGWCCGCRRGGVRVSGPLRV